MIEKYIFDITSMALECKETEGINEMKALLKYTVENCQNIYYDYVLRRDLLNIFSYENKVLQQIMTFIYVYISTCPTPLKTLKTDCQHQ
jgi:hypothetical protein